MKNLPEELMDFVGVGSVEGTVKGWGETVEFSGILKTIRRKHNGEDEITIVLEPRQGDA